MTGARPPIFLRFLRRVHHRLVAVRLLEWAGAGLLAGCAAAAAALIPILLWTGRPAWAAAAWAGGVGVAAGLAFGLGRRPRLIDAAVEADRQLRLADLLGTAWCLHARREGDSTSAARWAASILAMADARCAGLSPAAVVLRRFGARAWGGIGLAAALVLALASLSANPPNTRAGGADSPAHPNGLQPTVARAPDDRPVAGAPWDAPSRRRAGPTEGTDERHRRGMTSVTPDADRPGDTDARGTPRGNEGRPAADGDGGGAGMAQGNVKPPAAATNPPVPSNPPPANSTRPASSSTAGVASGSGRSAGTTGRDSASDPDGRGSVGPAPSPTDVPPWQSDTWATDVSRARASLDAGQVPVAYRDLVRRYFDRP